MVEGAGSRRLLLAAAQYLILRRRGRDLGNRLILESVVFRSQAVTDRSAESRTGIPEGRVQRRWQSSRAIPSQAASGT